MGTKIKNIRPGNIKKSVLNSTVTLKLENASDLVSQKRKIAQITSFTGISSETTSNLQIS